VRSKRASTRSYYGCLPDSADTGASHAATLRDLPAVDALAATLPEPPGLAIWAAREAIAAGRRRLRRGEPLGELEADARERFEHALVAAPRRVLNATGVIVHTNLGRAPLAERAAAAAAAAGGSYTDLELDLARGRRGSRQSHVSPLLVELTGAEDALVVNNCAAAVLLATASLCAGRELVVSRGQLVEIGGSFRIPEVVGQSGARLVEVGTTNRTRLADYRAAIGAETAAILCAHPSNFRVLGFTEEVPIEELCELGVPVIHDAGSGALATGIAALEGEPSIRRSLAAGCAMVCFSGDKLLGGPQAGILLGTREAIERCRHHPLARALRIDKLSLAALATTLVLYRDPALARTEIPVLRALDAEPAELARRAELIRAGIAPVERATVIEAAAKVGGGALPLLELTGPVCAVDPGPAGPDALAGRLRTAELPLVGRLREGRLLLDPRTLTDEEAELAAAAVTAALA
jgi:L-seryl-tRNA(Ser) seleniumtransferase